MLNRNNELDYINKKKVKNMSTLVIKYNNKDAVKTYIITCSIWIKMSSNVQYKKQNLKN